jgi:hypothetical protein
MMTESSPDPAGSQGHGWRLAAGKIHRRQESMFVLWDSADDNGDTPQPEPDEPSSEQPPADLPDSAA